MRSLLMLMAALALLPSAIIGLLRLAVVVLILMGRL